MEMQNRPPVAEGSAVVSASAARSGARQWISDRIGGVQDNLMWLLVAGLGVSLSSAFTTSNWGAGWGLSQRWVDRIVGGAIGACLMPLTLIGLAALRNYRRRGIERLARSRYVKGDKGILDFQVNLDTATNEMGRLLKGIGDDAGWVGKKAGLRATQYARATNARGRHRVVSRGAADMHRASARIGAKLAELEEATSIAGESMRAVIASELAFPHANAAAAEGIRNASRLMLEKVDHSLVTQEVFRGSILATRGLSQEMNAAADRLHTVLGRVQQCLEMQRDVARETIDATIGTSRKTLPASVSNLQDRAAKERS